ncbi:DNA internalization-related competence protein ComEC/Rec2 [Reinekea blandensis]|uniref:DNA uptake protein n=1 Tax=Reinekea blandensis MED297 TaxID=314283 RepID=A4BE10_9GAMM|nr:DNA internalization-related competence protein ComEC/Rec2 [Reinekea blandensis]EAR09769.1 DNA uptake protein [Reinekea blandensis MED297]
MTIAIILAGLIWAWFQFGLASAVVFTLLAGGLLLVICAYRITAAMILVLSLVVIAMLEHQMRHPLPSAFQHVTQSLTLCIEQVPRQYSDGTQTARARVQAQPESLHLRKIRLWLYPETTNLTLNAGDCFDADVRLRQPIGRLIPGTFNADRYNFAEKIDAYGTVVELSSIAHRPGFQQRLYLTTAEKLGDGLGLDVWAALALGWSRAMSPELKTLLADNQVMHLFVISGMHLAFVLLLVNLLIQWLAYGLAPWLMISRTQRYLLAGLVTTGYVAFLGFPLPVTRALLMFGLPIIGQLSAVRTGPLTLLGWTAVILMLWHPAAWLAIGPWLSFGSVAVIFLILRWRLLQNLPRLWQPILFQVLMTISILPWALSSGFSFNLLSVFSSLVLSGLIGFVGLPMALMMPIVDLTWLHSSWNQAVEWLVSLLTLTANPGLELPYLDSAALFLLVVMAVWAIWRRDTSSILVGAALLCLSILFWGQGGTNRVPSVTVYDVGHGQALLLDTGDDRFLYDTGGRFSPEQSLAEVVLHRVLPPLEGVVISHSDLDHAAGAGFLRGQYPRLPIWSGQRDQIPIKSSTRNCHQQTKLHSAIEVIPVPPSLRGRQDNNQSCVVLITLNHHRLLITGDADKYIEYYLLQTHPHLFPVDVLILGHHGSGSSSAGAFLEANQSAMFLTSSGDRLAPRWPAERIESWFSDQQKTLLNTAKLGTIQLTFYPQRIRVKTWDSAYRNRLIY